MMAKFLLVRPGINYRCSAGFDVFAGPGNSGSTSDVFDTADARRAVPANWQPPLVGAEALDAEAAAMLNTVRQPYAGKQTPGIGVVGYPAVIVEF
jgi:hypothetical protein